MTSGWIRTIVETDEEPDTFLRLCDDEPDPPRRRRRPIRPSHPHDESASEAK
jgi:hypothetical protein